jgi:hypothetical protein
MRRSLAPPRRSRQEDDLIELCANGFLHHLLTYYPRVNLVPQRILTTAGDAARIVTSGGASSDTDDARTSLNAGNVSFEVVDLSGFEARAQCDLVTLSVEDRF